jgi:hypothetical protein
MGPGHGARPRGCAHEHFRSPAGQPRRWPQRPHGWGLLTCAAAPLQFCHTGETVLRSPFYVPDFFFQPIFLIVGTRGRKARGYG